MRRWKERFLQLRRVLPGFECGSAAFACSGPTIRTASTKLRQYNHCRAGCLYTYNYSIGRHKSEEVFLQLLPLLCISSPSKKDNSWEICPWRLQHKKLYIQRVFRRFVTSKSRRFNFSNHTNHGFAPVICFYRINPLIVNVCIRWWMCWNRGS